MTEAYLPGLEDLRARLVGACRALKVFPLPGVVLLPGSTTPFNIFEPRYRALTADALAEDRFLAVPTLVSSEGATQQRPPLHPIAGAGFIEEAERHPDGRYTIVLRGVARVQLESELATGKPYREFKAEVLEDLYPAGGPAALVKERSALEACARALAKVLPAESGVPKLVELAASIFSPSLFADVVAAAVVSEPVQRLAVIEERLVSRRLDLVSSELASIILMLSRGRTPSA
ncbi:MAG TPA: LON peptidase substrate-binding domain-containing protein [Anaeromyxobacteraceae bacterium]|nr:LON peptidase substrate-binding domain-containing protein [Anaeromyxobacteraceae bacterium]